MKVLRFPGPEGMPEEAGLAELEAALHGGAVGPAAERWRELRADVRSLAPPVSEQFERELLEAIAARAESRPREKGGLRLRDWLGAGVRNRALVAGAIGVLVMGVLALAIALPRHGSTASTGRVESAGPSHAVMQAAPSIASAPAVQAPAAAGQPSAGREQQRAAQLTLAPKPGSVQSVADEVARLAQREGGYVQSSQVRVGAGSGNSAELRLSLPSARLSEALLALGRLAPTRSESQSLQDITDQYDSDRSRLAMAVAERQALLRALAHAETQGQIDSLRQRLALAAAAVARARQAFASISREARNSAVEVSVVGSAQAGADRSTLENGLHDALDVLKVALAVVLVALAVLMPLALALLAGVFAWRIGRRRLRERALS